MIAAVDMNEFDFAVNDLDSISRGGISVTSDFIPPEVVSSLRRDAEALLSAGAFVGGGLRLPKPPPPSTDDGDDDGDDVYGRSRVSFRNRRRRRRRRRHGCEESVGRRTAVGEDGGGGTTTGGGWGGDACPTTIDVRTRYCDVCGLFDDAENEAFVDVGDRTSRDGLLDLMSDLREYIMVKLNVDLSDRMELQYLHYPAPVGIDDNGVEGNGVTNEEENNDGTKMGGGGFYGRHLDRTGNELGPLARKFSLLLYLNDMGWDASRDGGVLRAYLPSDDRITRKEKERPSRRADDDDGHSIDNCDEIARVLDIVPEGGKLVLFDSSAVEHEVLSTYKERWAVVGWFLTEEYNDVSCDCDNVPMRERVGVGRAASNHAFGEGRREAWTERTPRKKRAGKRHKKGATTMH
jgi:hypothetical protein